jgi:hypothetical protein
MSFLAARDFFFSSSSAIAAVFIASDRGAAFVSAICLSIAATSAAISNSASSHKPYVI